MKVKNSILRETTELSTAIAQRLFSVLGAHVTKLSYTEKMTEFNLDLKLEDMRVGAIYVIKNSNSEYEIEAYGRTSTKYVRMESKITLTDQGVTVEGSLLKGGEVVKTAKYDLVSNDLEEIRDFVLNVLFN